MKRKKLLVSLFLVSAMLFTACGQSEIEISAETPAETPVKVTTLRMGMNEAAISDPAIASQMFCDLVEEYTEGRYKIDFFPGSALGDTAEVIEMVEEGSVELYRGGIGWYEQYNDDFRVFAMNWAFDNNDHVKKFFETDKFEEMKLDLKTSRNLHMIANEGYRLPRNVIATEPVRSAEELKDFSLRVPAQPMYLRSWQAVGVSPTQIEFGEAYMSLRQGVVKGAEGPLDTFESMSWGEVAPYVIYTEHLQNPYATVMTASLFDSLSAEDKAAFEKAAVEADKWYSEYTIEREAEIVKNMEDNLDVEFIRIDKTPLLAAAAPLAAELESEGMWSPGLYQTVRDLVD